MIVGFNTDIKHRGRVYHAQTEDKGKDNPLIETLVYTKGQILDTREKRNLTEPDAIFRSQFLLQIRQIVLD